MESVSLTTEQIARWDASLFQVLYKKYYKALVNYAFQIVEDRDDAEDIVQGLIYSFWKQHSPDNNRVLLPSFPTVFSFEVYLYNSVRNQCFNHLRGKKIENRHISEIAKRFPLYHLQDDERDLFKERTYRMLVQTIDTLPPRSREVFLLILQGYKTQEIAEIMNITIETVKTHRRRGIAFLRERLDDKAFAF